MPLILDHATMMVTKLKLFMKWSESSLLITSNDNPLSWRYYIGVPIGNQSPVPVTFVARQQKIRSASIARRQNSSQVINFSGHIPCKWPFPTSFKFSREICWKPDHDDQSIFWNCVSTEDCKPLTSINFSRIFLNFMNLWQSWLCLTIKLYQALLASRLLSSQIAKPESPKLSFVDERIKYNVEVSFTHRQLFCKINMTLFLPPNWISLLQSLLLSHLYSRIRRNSLPPFAKDGLQKYSWKKKVTLH